MNELDLIRSAVELKVLHQNVLRKAMEAVELAYELGCRLLKVAKEGKRGDLTELVKASEIPSRTAFRYMALAEEYQDKKLPNGIGLTALYRELGIIKTAEVGGPGSDVAKQGKSMLVQLEMCFNVFSTNLKTIRTVPFAELQKMDRAKLEATREELKATLETLDQALQPTVEA